MLFNLLANHADWFPGANLFRYVTFRTGGAIMTSLLICFLLGPHLIKWLKKKQGEGQPIRVDGPATHLAKKGTPTMGGLMILVSLVISTLLWTDLRNPYMWIVLFVSVVFGLVGFVDDYLKLTKRNTAGLSAKVRLSVQFLAAGAAIYASMWASGPVVGTSLAVPFMKDFLINLGWFYVPFALLVIVGASNAVNLTDGLDGLATVPVMIAAACLGIMAYLTGHITFAVYLGIPHIAGTGELLIFCGALVGACLGFLWFNAPPAMVFMGDTGSLAMGGALGAVSVVTKHEFAFAIIGGLFVLEAISVIVQVASFKMTGKRVFMMAPLHHHFEKKGWAESTVVIRFWIIAIVLALVGLATLKLR